MYLILEAKLGSVKSHTRSVGFEGTKWSWREPELWHCVAGLESLTRSQKKLLVKEQSKSSRILQHFRITTKGSRNH